MRKKLISSLLSLLTLPLWSQMLLRTSVKPILVPGYAEPTGYIHMIVNGNAFYNAEEEPFFLRFQLGYKAVAAQTLVDIEANGHHPISLALCVDTDDDTVVVAPEDAVQILRWRAGEREIWLKVSVSTSKWLSRGGELGAPSPDEPVHIWLGLGKDDALKEIQPYFQSNRSNLFTNSRDDGTPADTTIFVNTQDFLFRNEDTLTYGLIIYGDVLGLTTQESDSGIIKGYGHAVFYYGDDVLGKAVNPELRIIPHVTPDESLFETNIVMLNYDAKPQSVTTIAYDNSGEELGSRTEILDPGACLKQPSEEFFDGEPVSYFEIVNRFNCSVSVEYRERGVNKLPAVVSETKVLTKEFTLYTNGNSSTFDGLAAVNMGDESTHLVMTVYDAAGEMLGEYHSEDIASRSKFLWVLDDVYDFFSDMSYLTIRSTEPLAILVLKGTRPGSEPGVLYKNEVIIKPWTGDSGNELVNIPDPVFKDFLVRNFDNLDYDGEISVKEAQQVEEIVCENYVLNDLTGLEAFANLKHLELKNNQLSELPDLGPWSQLETLICSSNGLSALPDLKILPKLERLEIDGNNFENLDLSCLNQLVALSCASNGLTDLDISNCSNLEVLVCRDNLLSTLDCSEFQQLRELDCSNNSLENLNVRNISSIQAIRCQSNSLDAIDLTGLNQLRHLWCAGNQLKELDVQGCPEIYYLDCYNNQLTRLDCSPLHQLTYLYCGNNHLDALIVQNLAHIETLFCEGNYLESINLSGLAGLQFLKCSTNHLSELDISDCIKLRELLCSGNQLTSLPRVWTIPDLPLFSFYCKGNYFSEDDCDDIKSVTAMGLHKFQWNPQADGSTLICP